MSAQPCAARVGVVGARGPRRPGAGRLAGTALVVALLAQLGPLTGGAAAQSGADERPGNWSFKLPDRPIKAVIVGGSVSAWPQANYGHYLEAACPRVEIVNRAKARLGAKALKARFKAQVLRNRRVDPAALDELWLIFNGGLNSIGDPRGTNRAVAATLRAAHDAGLKTLAVSVGPWGSEKDKRWRGAAGLEYREDTQLAVDFVSRRLSAQQAFGGAATDYREGELPDIGVDLYDSGLRDAEAPLRDEARTRSLVTRSPWVKRRLSDVDEAGRPAALDRWVEEARSIPRWFMQTRYRAFDHIHPNKDGHRVMAQTICPALPESWGCDCPRIARLEYDRKARGLVERP